MKTSGKSDEILRALRAGQVELARKLVAETPNTPEHDNLFFRAFLAVLDGNFSADEIAKFAEQWPNSSFLGYLNAYRSLKNGDEETALYLYTQLVDSEEGWLARELIEKSKKNQLMELVQKQSPFYFIPLPEKPQKSLWRPPKRIHTSHGRKFAIHFNIKKILSLFTWRYLRWPVGFLSLLLLSWISWQLARRWLTQPKTATWQNLQLDEAAHLLPDSQAAGNYRYTSREQLLEDFRQARLLMGAGKINQSRYLLQRMLYSNADFRSREKARLFLNFIPIPQYETFSDNIPAAELLREPLYRSGSYLVWEGEMKLWKKEVGGYRGSMLLTEQGQNYLVEIFWPNPQVIPGSKVEDFYEERALQQTSRKAIVFGQFKNLVGSQKAIYLEAIKVWF